MSTNIRVRLVREAVIIFYCYLTGSVTRYSVFFQSGYYLIVLLFIKIISKKILNNVCIYILLFIWLFSTYSRSVLNYS